MLDMLATPEFWAPVVTSTGLVGLAGWLLTPWYKMRIERSIQHDFDAKLENLRTSLRREEDRLKANLRAQEDQLAALRSSALSQQSARRTAVEARRLQAVERLWASAQALAPARTAVEFVSPLHMDELIKRAHSGPDAAAHRKLGDVLWETSGLGKMVEEGLPKGHLERPFVSPLTWAIYSAYAAAVSHPIAQLAAVRTGMDSGLLQPSEVAMKPIREALPEWKDYIDKVGFSGLKYLVERLEQKLINQLQEELSGEATDQNGVEQAARIVEAVKAVRTTESPSPIIPVDLLAEKNDVRP